MHIRNPFNYDADAVSKSTGLVMTMPSLAQQQFKDEVDINTIAKQFGLTGQLPAPVYQPMFGDFTEVTDFQSALHQIQVAEASFAALPAAVRERFRNDAQKFVEFCSDERNREEWKALGLSREVPPPAPALPDPVNVTPSAPT